MGRLPALLPLALLTACPGVKDIGWEGEGEEEDPFVVTEDEVHIDEGYLGELSVEIEDGMTAFMVTATGDNYLDVEEVVDPDGDTVFSWEDWDGKYSLTEAVSPYYSDVTFNWPIREKDDRLMTGTYTVYLGSYGGSGRPREDDLDIYLARKRDDSFDSGVIAARVVYAKGVDKDEDVVAAVEGAVERWREIWAAYGIELDEEFATSDIDSDLPYPLYASNGIKEIANDTDGRQITVLIGETVEGADDLYGIAGGIPASMSATPRSAVCISWLANSGLDGDFSDDDIRLFGETLAHEVGHYTGLFHPVEMDWDYYDALSDTDSECDSMRDCQDALGDNLMFPYPVCSRTECTPQDQLSDGQVGVKMRYTGTK